MLALSLSCLLYVLVLLRLTADNNKALNTMDHALTMIRKAIDTHKK